MEGFTTGLVVFACMYIIIDLLFKSYKSNVPKRKHILRRGGLKFEVRELQVRDLMLLAEQGDSDIGGAIQLIASSVTCNGQQLSKVDIMQMEAPLFMELLELATQMNKATSAK